MVSLHFLKRNHSYKERPTAPECNLVIYKFNNNGDH